MKKRLFLLINISILFFVLFGVSYTQAAKKIKCKSIKLGSNTVVVGLGDIIYLDAITKPANANGKQKWTSSNKDVATVNEYGTITASSVGESVITVKIDGKKASCNVIVKEYLTANEVTDMLIKNNISEETIKKLIAENAVSEETVKKLIAEKTISEENIKKLIVSNTVSESKIDEIIQKKITESIENNLWEDGCQVKVYDKQKFPTVLYAPRTTDEMVKIDNVNVKKYHFDDYNDRDREFYKYKYEINIKGNRLITSTNINYLLLTFELFNKYGVNDGGGAHQIYVENSDKIFDLKLTYYSNVYADEIVLENAWFSSEVE